MEAVLENIVSTLSWTFITPCVRFIHPIPLMLTHVCVPVSIPNFARIPWQSDPEAPERPSASCSPYLTLLCAFSSLSLSLPRALLRLAWYPTLFLVYFLRAHGDVLCKMGFVFARVGIPHGRHAVSQLDIAKGGGFNPYLRLEEYFCLVDFNIAASEQGVSVRLWNLLFQIESVSMLCIILNSAWPI